ncbi:MAG: hypothetical protein ACXWWC_01475 [Chitinophagaceae bacterium]
MKKFKKNIFIFLLLPLLFTLLTKGLEAQKDSIPPKELVKLKYFNDNNSVQFLILENLLKTGKKIEPLKNKVFQLYLDSIKTENLVAKVTTDKNGKAKSFLPPSLKAAWDANPLHTFIAVAEGTEDESAAELEITKAKIQIDTASADGIRSITVQVMKFENNEWAPANEVEMKVGIQRLGGILSAGEAEVYTTDSSGTATVELNKDSLPGDEKGNMVLTAKVEDNDLFGNLLVHKTVPWGIALKPGSDFFDQRTLWSTRFHTPYWLLFMAYSIVISVWATIFYLIMQIVRIKKLGTAALDKSEVG